MLKQLSKGIPVLVIAAYVFVVIGLIAIFARSVTNRAAANVENAYGLVSTCALSVPATDRTKKDIENCYLRVEKKYNIELERFYPNE